MTDLSELSEIRERVEAAGDGELETWAINGVPLPVARMLANALPDLRALLQMLDAAEVETNAALEQARRQAVALDAAEDTITALREQLESRRDSHEKALAERDEYWGERNNAVREASRLTVLLDEARGLVDSLSRIMAFYTPGDDNVAHAEYDDAQAFLTRTAPKEG